MLVNSHSLLLLQFGLEAYEKQDGMIFDDALPYLKEQIAVCFEGDDAKEGIAAFLEKRALSGKIIFKE